MRARIRDLWRKFSPTKHAPVEPLKSLEGVTPPENVCLILEDGTAIPLQCVYDGLSADGVHQWSAITSENTVLRPGMLLTMDVLPAHTSVSFRYLRRREG